MVTDRREAIAWSLDSRKRGLEEGGGLEGGEGEGGGALSVRYLALADASMRDDSRPLLPGCGCHACRHFSRAYVHHLLVARELLCEVLLYAHNAYQTRLLMDCVRARLRGGAGELARWAGLREGDKEHASGDAVTAL